MSVSRRTALKVLGAASVAAVVPPTLEAEAAALAAAGDAPTAPPKPWKPAFLTAAEVRTLRVLADDIIPRDARSGSATEAGVIEFIDFHLAVEETPERDRVQWRGGFRWLDTEARRRFGKKYAALAVAQRHAILDDLAWPDRVKPEFRAGSAFFVRVRDLTAAGFFSSRMGHEDLRFIPGPNGVWTGAPQAVLDRLGVSYALMDSRPVKE